MTIDERLEALLKSSQALHASCVELHQRCRELRMSVEGKAKQLQSQKDWAQLISEAIGERVQAELKDIHKRLDSMEKRLVNLETNQIRHGWWRDQEDAQ